MGEDSNRIDEIEHSRRHLAKAGLIGVGAVLALLAKPKAASAGPAPASCFLKGTKIRTRAGDRKVEDLAIGDLLPTASGEMRPIQWIARYEYKKSDPSKAWADDVRPVRVAQSALEPNVPAADLFVTQGHALFMDGALVPVGSLINGATICWDDANGIDELEYFHIKLETHDVIYAEGAPCETLLWVGEAATNFVDYVRSQGMPAPEEARCAPVLSFNGGRSELQSRLRSAVSPWFDQRQKLDIIRDRLEARGIALRRTKAQGAKAGAKRAEEAFV